MENEKILEGAFDLHVHAAPTCPSPFSRVAMADMIWRVGCKKVILTSDFGQTANGNPVQGFGEYLEKMRVLGLSREEIRRMVCFNPRELMEG